MLNIQSIEKNYVEQTVLDAVSLQLAANETFGLVGLNGAGKTTLIKCILDMQKVSKGQISIGNIVSDNYLARKHLSYLPEKFSPPDYMSGLMYLQYINDAHLDNKLDKSELHEESKNLCEQIELPFEVLSKSVKTYSKGMLQKLGLIGCILSGKQLLILDEPMSGLDPKARVLFRNLIQSLKSSDKTIIFCTHILNDVEILCDRVGILHQGKLLYVGDVQECCKRYAAEDFEAAFLKCIEDG